MQEVRIIYMEQDEIDMQFGAVTEKRCPFTNCKYIREILNNTQGSEYESKICIECIHNFFQEMKDSVEIVPIDNSNETELDLLYGESLTLIVNKKYDVIENIVGYILAHDGFKNKRIYTASSEILNKHFGTTFEEKKYIIISAYDLNNPDYLYQTCSFVSLLGENIKFYLM